MFWAELIPAISIFSFDVYGFLEVPVFGED